MIENTAAAGRDGTMLSGHPWLRASLISATCLVVGGLAFLVLLGVELEESGGDLPAAALVFVLVDVVLGVTAAGAVGFIKDSRLGNMLVVVAAIFSSWALLAWLVSVVRLASRRSYALDVIVVGITVCGAVAFDYARSAALGLEPIGVWFAVLGSFAVTALAILWGRVRGTRAALVAALREQAASAQRAHRAAIATREAEIARARAEERTAIARDMHDGISHKLAVVAMHAGALSYRDDISPAQHRQTAETVREAAVEASNMLRESLTALRDPADSRPLTPLPNAESIDALADNARAGGHDVTVAWLGITHDELSQDPGRATALARIVDELIVNARKYAPNDRLSVEFERTAVGLELRASNPLTLGPRMGVGTGLGLVGVAERAQILGGAATFGPTPDGTFQVEVRIP